jgi:protein gp37
MARHNARPFDVAWARSIVAQCQVAGVACFMKQLGALPTSSIPAERLAGSIRSKHGEPSEWPSDLRVRNFPEVAR